MRTRLEIVFGGAGAVAILVLGLWTWQNAMLLAERWQMSQLRPAVWSLRCFTIALVAIAQVLLLRFVVDVVYRRDTVSETLRLSALLLFMMAAASAIALGLVGR